MKKLLTLLKKPLCNRVAGTEDESISMGAGVLFGVLMLALLVGLVATIKHFSDITVDGTTRTIIEQQQSIEQDVN